MYPQRQNHWAQYQAVQYGNATSHRQPNYQSPNNLSQIPFNHYPSYSSAKSTFSAPSLPYGTKFLTRNNFNNSFTR